MTRWPRFSPALAEASRTVGSPQIRNAGTLAGNLGTCSPAGDALPVLAALDADGHAGVGRRRSHHARREFMVGVKRTAIEPGELIVEITVPTARGWQGYAKVGVRNAMVIAVASACLVVDDDRRSGSRSPSGRSARRSSGATRPRRGSARALDWATMTAADDDLVAFGQLAAAAARPITDHRSTAEYRRHAVGVLATRLARRAVAAADDRRWRHDDLDTTNPGTTGDLVDHFVLHVNGVDRDVHDSWLGESLLDVLRDRLGLAGTKGACEQGECGSCSVLVDDVLVCSCLVMAASAVGQPSSRSKAWPRRARRPTSSRPSSTPVPCSAGSARLA